MLALLQNQKLIKASFLKLTLLRSCQNTLLRPYRQFTGNNRNFWDHVSIHYTEARFKSSSRVKRGFFHVYLRYFNWERLSLRSRLVLITDWLFFFIEWEAVITFILFQNYLERVTLKYVIQFCGTLQLIFPQPREIILT